MLAKMIVLTIVMVQMFLGLGAAAPFANLTAVAPVAAFSIGERLVLSESLEQKGLTEELEKYEEKDAPRENPWSLHVWDSISCGIGEHHHEIVERDYKDCKAIRKILVAPNLTSSQY